MAKVITMILVELNSIKATLRLDSKSKRALYPDFSRNAKFFE